MPSTTAEKISETEVKLTSTVERIVKLSELEYFEGQILREKAQLEKHYQERGGMLNANLLAIQEQLAEARKVLNVKVEESMEPKEL
jgi:hypothetical protein